MFLQVFKSLYNRKERPYMLDEYLEFYTAYAEIIENEMDDLSAMEGFSDTASALMKKASAKGTKIFGQMEQGTGKLLKGAEDVGRGIKNFAINLIEQLIANVITISSNLKGFYINKRSEILMNNMIQNFEDIIDMCLYDTEKVFQGLTKKDRENGVKIFNTKATIEYDVLEKAAKISAAAKALEVYQNNLNMIDSKQDPIDYKSSVELQRKMLKFAAKARSLRKKLHVLASTRIASKQYGMDSVIEYIMNVNRQDVARMASMITQAYGLLRVKPGSANGNPQTMPK